MKNRDAYFIMKGLTVVVTSNITIIVILWLLSLHMYGQGATFVNKLESSNHCFKNGMKLYKEGKYSEAISEFELSKLLIEEANVNTLCYGYEYLWIASCYYKLGDEETATKYSDSYKHEPLNRFEFNKVDSILCVSDSLFKDDFVYSAIDELHKSLSIADKYGIVGRFWKTYRIPYFVHICIDKELYNDALELCLLNYETSKEFYEEKSKEYIQCYCDLLNIYKKKEDYVNAIKIGQEAVLLTKDSKYLSKEFYPTFLIQIVSLMSEYDSHSFSSQIRDYILKAQKATIDLFSSDKETSANVYKTVLNAAEKTEDKDLIIELCDAMMPLLHTYYQTSEKIQNTYFYILNCLSHNYNEKGETSLAEYYLNELKQSSKNKSKYWYLTALTQQLYYFCDRGLYGQVSLLFEDNKQEILSYLVELSKEKEYKKDYGLFCYRLASFYAYTGQIHDAINLGEQALRSLLQVDGTADIALISGVDLMKNYIDLGYWQDALIVGRYLWEHYIKNMEEKNVRNLIELSDILSQCVSDIQNKLDFLSFAYWKSKVIWGESHYRTLDLEFKMVECKVLLGHEVEWYYYLESIINSLQIKWKQYNSIYLQRRYYDFMLKNGRYRTILSEEQCYLKNSNRPLEDLLTSHVWIAQAYVYSDLDSSDCLVDISEVDRLQKMVGNNIHLHYLFNEQSKMLNSTSYYKWHQKVLPQLAYYKTNDSIKCYLYNSRLQNNNMQANYEIEFRHKLQQSDDSIQKQYRKYIIEKNIVQKMNEDYDIEKDLSKIWSVQNEIKKKEMELLKYYQDQQIINKAIDWTQIRNGLKTNDIAIEFVEFPDTTGTLRYMALTIKKDYEYPHLTPLFTADEIGSSSSDSILYHAVWEPLEEEFTGVNRAFFSASGKLNYLPIENIKMKNGRILSDQYELYRLSSTAEILHRQKQILYNKVALFGGIDYEASNSLRIDRISDNQLSTHRSFVNRSLPDSVLKRGGFEYLKESLLEVKDIKGSLDKGNFSVLLFTDSLGTEKSLKDMSGQEVNIMHFATHGMYMYPEEAEQRRSANNFKFISTREADTHYTTEDKALTRSFLVMAGGNKLLRRDIVLDEEDDGVLTALEISLLDFRNLDLVVLSACQSGLGDTSIDGVVGLQRGFKKAGANTILMSLDKVDDEATKILMVEFYRNLMSGKTKHQSLKDAQKHLRKVEKGKYDKPEYWASFIMLDGLN